MAVLTAAEGARGVVTASAGNHAQGVALAARQLGIRARIYMPRSTPGGETAAVRHHGGRVGGNHARRRQLRRGGGGGAARTRRTRGAVYIHAYDDLQVMAGQGTLADEVVLTGQGPFDAAFLQIGGGGMAAGVSTWLKTYWPGIEIVGVEGERPGQHESGAGGGAAGGRWKKWICFATARRCGRPGSFHFRSAAKRSTRMETVTNAEVSQAMRVLWEGLRCVSEPSGAMGLAAVLQKRENWTANACWWCSAGRISISCNSA